MTERRCEPTQHLYAGKTYTPAASTDLKALFERIKAEQDKKRAKEKTSSGIQERRMINPSAKKQLANIWQGVVDDLMEMSESEIDAELRELGIDPRVAAEKARSAVEEAVGKDRTRQRAALREQMEAARGRPKLPRDSAITAEQARECIAQLK